MSFLRIVRDGLGFGLLLGIYISRGNLFLHDFQQTGRIASLIVCLKYTVDVLFFTARRPAAQLTPAFRDWFVAILGTWLSLLFIPATDADNLFINGLIIFGDLFSFIGILSLNRSFGIVAANRGVQSSGLYRFVRHPMYLGYFISNAAVVGNNFVQINVIVFLGWSIAQLLRILAEERLLSKDPQYREFKQRTRWRLIPGIF